MVSIATLDSTAMPVEVISASFLKAVVPDPAFTSAGSRETTIASFFAAFKAVSAVEVVLEAAGSSDAQDAEV